MKEDIEINNINHLQSILNDEDKPKEEIKRKGKMTLAEYIKFGSRGHSTIEEKKF